MKDKQAKRACRKRLKDRRNLSRSPIDAICFGRRATLWAIGPADFFGTPDADVIVDEGDGKPHRWQRRRRPRLRRR